MTAFVLCMLLCAGGFAGLGARRTDRAVFDIVAATCLIGALALLGSVIGLTLPL